MDEKNNLLEILRNFSKILKIFLQKIAKMHYFSRFFTQSKKICVDFFSAFGRKRQFIGNFEKIVENFENPSSENCLKCIILAYLSKEFNKPCVHFFARLDEKDNLLVSLRKFRKDFLRKLLRMHYFSIFFNRI